MFLSRTNRPVEEEMDDPLSLYESIIAQHVQMNETVLKTIEVGIFKYKNDVRYMNSPRYLRLWLMYILYLNPTLILPILYGMIDNHIGDKLATLYEATAYYQFKQNRIDEAEATLLLGLKHKAQPIKRLERVLDQFYLKKTIEFDTNLYQLKYYHYDHHHIHRVNHQEESLPSKGRSLKIQLDWIDVKLQHTIRAGLLRECNDEGISFEELRAKSLEHSHHHLVDQESFISFKKDMDDVYNAVKRRKKSKNITPPGSNYDRVQPLPTPEPEERRESTPSPAIPTMTEQETVNVVQLPHNSGFIQNQFSSHGLFERDDYHIYNNGAQFIQKKLRVWFPVKGTHTTAGLKVIQLGNNKEEYHVVKKLGQGGMAHVYLVQNTNNLSFYGLKVQQPPHPWEFYILSRLHERKAQQQQQYHLHLLPVFDFHHYTDTSFLFMSHIRHGTLLDALNLYRNQPTASSTSMPEPIVLMFTLQLLKEIMALHSLHITHNDLKLDNIMLAMKNNKIKLPSVIMIDFGRSVDLDALGGAMYKANWPPACPQSDYPLLNKSHHPIHADYWQLATMVHLLLFGNPMQYTQHNNRYSIRQKIKRYWHTSLWTTFFDTMLNLQLEQSLDNLIQEFEKFSHDVPEKLIQTFLNLLVSA